MAAVSAPSSSPRFVPVHPPRQAAMRSPLANLLGDHARNAIAGWSVGAFEQWDLTRNVLGLTVHIPRHPDAVQRVLLDHVANYPKPRLVKRVLNPLIGRGLLMVDGAMWRTQRKLVAASFAPGAVNGLAPLMAAAAARSTAGWPERGTIDIAHVATDTTMRVIADALFSGDPRLTSDAALRHIEAALVAVGQIRLTAVLGLPALPIGRVARAGDAGRRYLRATLERIVRERGADGGRDDFLGGLIRDLNARFAPGEALGIAIDNAATFYVAGHETTANVLAWSLYLMASVPEVQARARAEAQAALAGDPAQIAARTPYLRQVIDEAMRLYPPVPRMEREALADDELHGVAIRKGDLVSIWPWLIHRHRGLWDDPDAFDPDRFAPGREAERHRFQYLPFGAGPRVCVGQRFGLVEAQIILAHWLAARRFALAPGFVPDPVATVTLRPRGGMRIALAPL